MSILGEAVLVNSFPPIAPLHIALIIFNILYYSKSFEGPFVPIACAFKEARSNEDQKGNRIKIGPEDAIQ